MEQTVFKQFSQFIYDKSGITLNDNKESLVSARVSKRMRQLGIGEYDEYLDLVKNDDTGEEIIELLDVISTNVTNFFREPDHFDIVRDVMATWLKNGTRRFTFWSAACSSGEEPYTLAMVLREATAGTQVDMRILATDISTKILEKSMEGVYEAKKTEDIPALYREKYFTKEGIGDQALFTIKDSLRSIITFKRINLSIVPYPMKGPMDIVFCRNVMIYFDNRVRVNLLNEIHRLLKPGGILFVGHAESLTGILSGFKSVKPSVYIKN